MKFNLQNIEYMRRVLVTSRGVTSFTDYSTVEEAVNALLSIVVAHTCEGATMELDTFFSVPTVRGKLEDGNTILLVSLCDVGEPMYVETEDF